jgi:hypothetical protein
MYSHTLPCSTTISRFEYEQAKRYCREIDPTIVLYGEIGRASETSAMQCLNQFMFSATAQTYPGEVDCILVDQFMSVEADGSAIERLLRGLRLAKIGQTIVIAKKHASWISLAWFRTKAAEPANSDDRNSAEWSLALNFTITEIAALLSELESLTNGEEIRLTRSEKGFRLQRLHDVSSMEHAA